MIEYDYDETMSIVSNTTICRLILVALFSLLSVGMLESVAAGDLLNAPNSGASKAGTVPRISPAIGKFQIDDTLLGTNKPIAYETVTLAQTCLAMNCSRRHIGFTEARGVPMMWWRLPWATRFTYDEDLGHS